MPVKSLIRSPYQWCRDLKLSPAAMRGKTDFIKKLKTMMRCCFIIKTVMLHIPPKKRLPVT